MTTTVLSSWTLTSVPFSPAVESAFLTSGVMCEMSWLSNGSPNMACEVAIGRSKTWNTDEYRESIEEEEKGVRSNVEGKAEQNEEATHVGDNAEAREVGGRSDALGSVDDLRRDDEVSWE